MNDPLFLAISECISSGDVTAIENHTRAALQAGIAPMTVIERGLIPGMEKLGEDFGKGEIYLPELLIGAAAMQASLAIIKPLLKTEEIRSRATIVIGTVLGDVHDIGKNIVAWMLEGAGFAVIDLGVDVGPEKYIEAVEVNAPQILALSALLTTSAPQIGVVIRQLTEKGLRDRVKIMIGGASVSQAYADRVGADGYAIDAVTAVAKAKELAGMQSQEG